MHRILLLYVLLCSCTLHGQVEGNSIVYDESYADQHKFPVLEQASKNKAVKLNAENILLSKDSLEHFLDTIYFPFYNGIQMIMIEHTKLYNDKYSGEIALSSVQSQMPYLPPAPAGNEYFFRNVEGNIVKAYNTFFSPKVLSCYFQNIKTEEKMANSHEQYFADTNLYYLSKNMHIHNGYYSINNGGVKNNGYQRGAIFIEKPIKYGLIDTLGNIVVDPIYDQVLSVPKGFLVQKEGKWGMINGKQEELLPLEYESHSTDYYHFDNFPFGSELTYFFKNGRYKVAYFMKHDSLIFLDEYSAVLDPKKGLFISSLNGKYGIVDLVNKKVLLPTIYEKNDWFPFRPFDPNKQFYHLEHGYIIARKNGKLGIVNLKNKVILRFKYDKIYDKHQSRKGYFKVELDGEIIEVKQ
jgi:hypothetical protein